MSLGQCQGCVWYTEIRHLPKHGAPVVLRLCNRRDESIDDIVLLGWGICELFEQKDVPASRNTIAITGR